MQAMTTAFGMVTNVRALAKRLKTLKAPAGYEVEAVVFEAAVIAAVCYQSVAISTEAEE